MSTIAVVDDEKNIRETIRLALEKEFHQVREYANGEEAWEGFRRELPDLVVLDIMMPRMDGMELCRRLREISREIPIIFLSSRDEEIDRVLGLESGGDDYVCKPFGMRELLARIRASLRRLPVRRNGSSGEEESAGFPDSGENAAPLPLCRGPLFMDEERHLALWYGTPVPLTVTEFRILGCLASTPGFVKTREQLMQAAFPDDSYPNDRAADSHIKRIRKKLQQTGGNPGEGSPEDPLETIYGLGYRFRIPG